MSDQNIDYQKDYEAKYSREQGFFDRSSWVRFAITAIFFIALFAFVHYREVRVEVLELESIAPGYIVAQIDFEFLDQDATVILKEEAVRDIGKIYLISSKDVRSRRLEFDNTLLFNQDWRKELQKTTYEDLYQAGDLVEKTLMIVRFTDPRTLRKIKGVGIPTDNYLVFTPQDVEAAVTLPPSIWEFIREKVLASTSLSQDTIKFVLDYFKTREWHLEEDLSALPALRKKVQSKVKDKYTTVHAGTRIIDQGEKVTPRHIAMLQAMKRALTESRNLWHPMTIMGSAMLTALLLGISIAYLRVNHPLILSSNLKLFLLVTVILLTLGISKAVEYFLLSSNTHLIEVVRYPVLVPFAAIVLGSLMNPSLATYASGFLTVVLTMTLAFERSGFMLMNIAAAIVAILSTRTLRRRKEIFIVCGKTWICCVLVVIALYFYQNNQIGPSLLADILSTGFCMLLTGVLVVGLLPLFESGFSIMTDVSLMEYMDPNSDLLRRLSIEAPGTYQHSVLVGNLAEAAALSIGANGLFCRVSTLYHDIGKMTNPLYFTENQQGGVNIHQLLTPVESSQVIINHVSEGVALARKAGLPEQFIDIIKEHHGTQLVYYFFKKELERLGGDQKLVNEEEFRYSGPKPRSKESVIIMIADSFEAASRSLETQSEESLTNLINRLIKEKAEDGQFDESLLTFEELAKVKETLVKTLLAFGHTRVKYPARVAKGAEDA